MAASPGVAGVDAAGTSAPAPLATPDPSDPPLPPARVASAHLVLRAWTPADAPALRDALARTWDDLQRWIPWVFPELESVTRLEARLAGWRSDLLAGGNALYGIWDVGERELLGGVGLYRRVGPGGLEIGYWVRSDRSGRGVATEAARLMTDVGLGLDGVDRVEIRCDPDHRASQAVPRKLGFRLRETLPPDPGHPGGPRETAVWERRAGAAEPDDQTPAHGGGGTRA